MGIRSRSTEKGRIQRAHSTKLQAQPKTWTFRQWQQQRFTFALRITRKDDGNTEFEQKEIRTPSTQLCGQRWNCRKARDESSYGHMTDRFNRFKDVCCNFVDIPLLQASSSVLVLNSLGLFWILVQVHNPSNLNCNIHLSQQLLRVRYECYRSY